MIKLTTERLLVAAALLLVVLACAAPRQCAGLPWEEAQRVLYDQQLRSGGNGAATVSKRDFILDFPVCPNHPRAVPQAFINQRFMPERLRQAIKNISASFQTAAQANGVQALSVGIVYDQELVWEQGYGLIDPSNPSSQVDANTIYRVGSITKLITNVMLFQLRDQGKLSLDDPVSKYVPELVWPTPFKNNPGITWRSLAGQISGLTGATPCNLFTIFEPLLGDACEISNAEAWKRVTADPDPHYADGAYAIIGRALESVVGMSYEDYVTQHIFKPLGMDSSFLAYNSWSDMAKRVPPGMVGNTTFPSFVAHADLNWARATGNVYSTVRDLAKLASLFMVGQDERKNVLGIYSSTLREMLTPSFVNDEQTSGYGYPFEVYHSRAFGKDMPPYWVRIKAGMMPGYFSVLAMFPEVKTAMIMQTNSLMMPWEQIALLLPAIEQTLWDLQPTPNNPGNLTAYAGTYVASVLGGFMSGNVTVTPDLPNHQLLIAFSLAGVGSAPASVGASLAVWEHDNTFRMLGPNPGTAGCMYVETGYTNVLVHFKVGDPSWFGGPTQVVSFEAPTDPFYGWVFTKQ